MASVEQKMEEMVKVLVDALDDAGKHGKGNNAAGGRVRKALQRIATSCKELRKQVQEERNAK